MPEISACSFTVVARVLTLACFFFPVLLRAQLSPAEAAGKQIYMEGVSPSGQEMEAILGEGSTRVPANLMPCASCHGRDGKGRPEGGVAPSEITWERLTSALRSTAALERHRPAYTIAMLQRAIFEGTDPAGNPLGTTMPRYRLSSQDRDNLIQYLKVLGKEPEPGVTEISIRVGTIIPASGPLAAAGQSSAALLKAYFAELNRQGGIYGRQVELLVLEASGSPEEIEHQAAAFIRDQNIFAISGVLAPGSESRIAGLMERLGVPAIAAFASIPEAEIADRTKNFYLLSGLPQQARVLVKFARDHFPDTAARMAIVYPEGASELANMVKEQCHALSFRDVFPLQYSRFVAAEISQELNSQKVEAVFFLGRGKELEEMLAAAAKLDWRPTIYQPGSLAGQEILEVSKAFDERIFLSFPTLPSDLDPAAIAEYRTLAAKHKLTTVQPALSLAVLATAKVLLEGLRNSGRQLNRDKFISTLSSTYGFNTGLTPPVTYGATRRIGALGAYIVMLDLKNRTLAPTGPWMAP